MSSRPPEARPAAPAAPFTALALLVGCLFACQMLAFHWGVVTPDTVVQWGQALSGRYDDWHPPATAWLWRQLIMPGGGSASVLLFHAALYWGGVLLIADTLRRRGAGWAMAGVLLCAASPIAFGQMGALLKDPLLAACCLLAGGLIFAREGAAGGWRAAAGAGAAILLLYASATRFNAFFAVAPLLAALAPTRWTGRPLALVLTLGGGALLALGANWLIDSAALRPHRSQPIYSLVNFDLAGIVAQGGADAYPDLDPATARRITAHCYSPGQYNPHYLPECDRSEEGLRRFAAARGRGALSIWIGAIARHPAAYLRHRLAHLNRNWRLLVADVPDDAVYVMTTPNPYGLDFRDNAATRLVARAAQTMAASPLGRPASWVAVALGLLLAGGALPSRRFVLGMAGSAACYGLGYAVFSVAPDMRYNFWTMLAAAMALVVALSEWAAHPRARPARGRLALALLPSVLAVGTELAGLAGAG